MNTLTPPIARSAGALVKVVSEKVAPNSTGGPGMKSERLNTISCLAAVFA